MHNGDNNTRDWPQTWLTLLTCFFLFLSEAPFIISSNHSRGSIWALMLHLFCLTKTSLFKKFLSGCLLLQRAVGQGELQPFNVLLRATGEQQQFPWVTKALDGKSSLLSALLLKNRCIKRQKNASCWSRESGSSMGQNEALFSFLWPRITVRSKNMSKLGHLQTSQSGKEVVFINIYVHFFIM